MGSLVWLLAAACGISVANLYYNQPLLAQMGASLGADTSFLPTYTQLGTGLGMFLFVPLGDMRERRGLICAVSLAAVAACCLTAAAPTVSVMIAASFLVGLTAVVPHLILPFAAQIARPGERGRVLGVVLSGLLIGILLARTLSGFLSAALGWRAVYWFAAGLMLVLAGVLRAALPRSEPTERFTYVQLLGSIWKLVVTEPLLREAALIGGFLFGCFSAFWATLIFVLATPPFHYGSRMAGTFGLIGLAGAAAASLAGRLTDRKGAGFTVGLGIFVTGLSWLVFLVVGRSLWGLVAGVTVLDLGVQAGHVANQTRIYGINPGARSRLNTVYMVTYFSGGAMGSALGAAAWTKFGWGGLCATGLMLSAAAGLVKWRGARQEQRAVVTLDPG